jgi:hypothetical protein
MKPIARLRYIASSMLVALSLAASQAFAGLQPLQVRIFVHQDVTESVDSIEYNYLSHWAKAIKDISGREVKFEYITEANAITTMDYRTENLQALMEELKTHYLQYDFTHRLEGDEFLQKGLLLTRHALNDSIGGVAYDFAKVGVASLVSYSFPAHELGHIFGATHENARAGWCDTYMVPRRNSFKAQCYGYSEANERVIGERLDNRP